MHVFLSPHFDDAVLSCGGTIHALTDSSQAVQILTIMGGVSSVMPNSPIVQALHARWMAGDNAVKSRQKEDLNAAKRLGASTKHLGLPDCIYRTIDGTVLACYSTSESLFSEIHPFDSARWFDLDIPGLFDATVVEMFIPLGVGHHVDHQIVRNHGIALKRQYPSLALKFYEEYPYTRNTMAIQRALHEMAWVAPDFRLELETVELNEANIQAKVEAIACYQSQISSFWPDLQVMEREVREMLLRASDGVPVERYWRVASVE